jgi:hypothetical protein
MMNTPTARLFARNEWPNSCFLAVAPKSHAVPGRPTYRELAISQKINKNELFQPECLLGMIWENHWDWGSGVNAPNKVKRSS